MRNPRTVTILLTAFFVVVGCTCQQWVSGSLKIAAPSVSTNVTRASLVESFESATVISSGDPITRVRTLVPAVTLPVMTTHQLSVDATALVAEMCDLQLLAHDTHLSLSSRQWSAFAAVVLRAQAIRQTYEAQIATAKVIAPGQYRLEIPVYASAGDMLREKFNADLRTELGEVTAADIVAKLGERLEGRFAGFGVGVQTLDIIGNLGGTLNDVQVTRTVTYWNSREGSDQLTTRREIHFPAWEDPTGDSWSALLAIVKA